MDNYYERIIFQKIVLFIKMLYPTSDAMKTTPEINKKTLIFGTGMMRTILSVRKASGKPLDY